VIERFERFACEEGDAKIRSHLDRADIILFLISSDVMALTTAMIDAIRNEEYNGASVEQAPEKGNAV
jgi:hypothetical protein